MRTKSTDYECSLFYHVLSEDQVLLVEVDVRRTGEEKERGKMSSRAYNKRSEWAAIKQIA